MQDYPPLFDDTLMLHLNEVYRLGTNDTFGGLEIVDGIEEVCDMFYFTDSPCQLCVLTQAVF